MRIGCSLLPATGGARCARRSERPRPPRHLDSRNRRERAFGDQGLSEAHTLVVVQIQNRNRRPADGCQTHQQRPVPAKVIRPMVASRVKDRHKRLRQGVDAGQIWTPLAIAPRAAQREIGGIIIEPMLRSDNVIDVECGFVAGLRELAVFAPTAGTRDDQGTCC